MPASPARQPVGRPPPPRGLWGVPEKFPDSHAAAESEKGVGYGFKGHGVGTFDTALKSFNVKGNQAKCSFSTIFLKA